MKFFKNNIILFNFLCLAILIINFPIQTIATSEENTEISTYDLGTSDKGEFYADSEMVAMFKNYYATTISYNSTEEAIELKASAHHDTGAFFTVKDNALSADEYKYIVVTYKTIKDTTCQLFLLTAGNPGASADFESNFTLEADGKYHSKIIDLSSYTKWTGLIHGFRFDYFKTSNDNDIMYVDSIAFCKTMEDANYIKWERECVRNTPGIFIACEEMIRLFDGFHMCSVDYDSEEEALVLTVEGDVCKTTAANGSHITQSWTCAPGFDAMTYFTLPSSLSSSHKYLVITYMTPNEPESIIGVDHNNNTLQTVEALGGIPVVIYPRTATGNVTENYQRKYKIHESNVYYSDYVNLEDEEYMGATISEIRIDPFNLHYSTVGSKLYISSIIFCETIEEADEIVGNQLDSKYPYNYEVCYDENASDDLVSGMPSSYSVVRSSNTSYTFNLPVDNPTRENYEFVGWSETSDGNSITETTCTVNGIKGEKVEKTLYAIWEEKKDYIIYIPDTLEINQNKVGTMSISADIDNITDSASISVLIEDIDSLILEDNSDIKINYELSDSAGEVLENGNVVASFSKSDLSDKEIIAEVIEEAVYSGKYIDVLSFSINYNS